MNFVKALNFRRHQICDENARYEHPTNKMSYKSYIPVVDPARGVVDPLVRIVPAPVFKGVLDGGHPQHKCNGDHGDFLPERVDRREPVEQHNKQKVKVRHTMELLEQVFGQERQHCVLGGSHVVTGEYMVGVLLGRRVHGHRVIRHHHAHFSTRVVLRAPPPEEHLRTHISRVSIIFGIVNF
jgi:hypothetical protein